MKETDTDEAAAILRNLLVKFKRDTPEKQAVKINSIIAAANQATDADVKRWLGELKTRLEQIQKDKTDLHIMADKFKKLAPAKQTVVLDKMTDLIVTEPDAEVKSLFSAVRSFLSGLTKTEQTEPEFGERHRAELISDLEGLKEASDE